MLLPDPPAATVAPGAHVLILYEVRAYAAWKAVFDAAASIRREAGERSYQVLRDDTDPNLVVHFSRWTSHAEARRFFAFPGLEQIRRDAGVTAPRFIYLHQLEAGVLCAEDSSGTEMVEPSRCVSLANFWHQLAAGYHKMPVAPDGESER